MQYYIREDDTVCRAIQFKGQSDSPSHLLDVLTLLTKAELTPLWRAELETDEWEENEAGDDYVKVVLPEHIQIVEGADELQLGGYVLERDGDIYIMAQELFEAIWSPAVTDCFEDWEWEINVTLPYAKTTGYWQHKALLDVVSTDGGVTYFRLSERPKYQLHGPLYTCVMTEGKVFTTARVQIADICKHCGRSVVNYDTAGTVFDGFKHTEGKQNGLKRCWPEDTGMPYGLDATPRSHTV